MQSSDWPIEALSINQGNPRRDVRNDPDYPGLLASIKSQGILQPLLIDKDGKILAGHRRYAAAIDLGLQRVPVRVVPEKTNHTLVPLIENLQRKDLSVMEIADYLLECKDTHGLTIVAMSSITGLSMPTVSKYIELAQCPAEIRERIERDEITLGAAFSLLHHDREFIQEVIKEPVLTRQIVQARAKAAGRAPHRIARPSEPQQASTITVCPSDRKAHLEYAIRLISGLLNAAPDDVFATRYKRWLTIMEDDLADEEAKGQVEATFRGAVNSFQRQPKERRAGVLN